MCSSLHFIWNSAARRFTTMSAMETSCGMTTQPLKRLKFPSVIRTTKSCQKPLLRGMVRWLRGPDLRLRFRTRRSCSNPWRKVQRPLRRMPRQRPNRKESQNLKVIPIKWSLRLLKSSALICFAMASDITHITPSTFVNPTIGDNSSYCTHTSLYLGSLKKR